ncbi:MAG TPA: SUMF1/EgtB/PvdO family nonheme iron enzyme, partial [Thermoanaerobaculia bacterium]|nr:SUMF1/EgtB/PvdO family nonheme iron enzyme [Thermoanaerobaculia bacterium]
MATVASLPAEPLSAAHRRRRAAELRDRLERVRERTLALVAPVDWTTLRRQHLPILSPMVWDLGHTANFEELWLVQRAAGEAPMVEGYGEMFDAMLNPRKDRERLALPDQRLLFKYLGRVRERALRTLERWAEEGAGGDRLLRGGFAFELIAEHEEQHQETILQALQTMTKPPYVPALRRLLPPGRPAAAEMVRVEAGPFLLGTDEAGFAYDNERRAHEVHLPAFWIDSTPVTQGAFAAFLDDGGYRRPELWHEAGWAWREERGAVAPGNWVADGRDGWRVRNLDRLRPLPEGEPVAHVSYWEAAAFARWAGKRLPTEPEWEKAATWDPGSGTKRRYPWGDEPPTPERANLDQLAFGPAPVGAYPEGASPCGAQQMMGDVWEWTASDFGPYPGFEAFPYREYSEVFFGPDYKVL